MGREPHDRGFGDEAPTRENATAALRRALPRAGPAELARALDHPALGVPEMILLLRNTRTASEVLARVAADARWLRHGRVRRLLAAHPNVSPATAGEVLRHLLWNELLEVGAHPRAHPYVRRRAEEMLRARVDELSPGERVSLARRAPRGILSVLIDTDDARVLDSALGNGRLVEADALRIASTRRSPSAVLGRLAVHPRWGARLAVRLALLRNSATPVPAALRLVSELGRRELTRVARDATIPRIVRVAAERRAAAGRLL